MSSSVVVAIPNMSKLEEAVENANKNGKLLVLEFIGSVSYKSTCASMKPTVDSIANQKNRADFCTIDVDKDDDFKKLAEINSVQALPTFLLIKDYNIQNRIIVPDKEELTRSIDEAT